MGGSLNLNGRGPLQGTLPTYINANTGVAIAAQNGVNLSNRAVIRAGGLTSDIAIITNGSITLSNGSYIETGRDVFMALNGSDSRVVLNGGVDGPSYVLTEFTNDTTHIEFLNVSKDGVVINGSETTSSKAGGSGFFAFDTSTPVSEGSGLDVTYAESTTKDDASKVIDQYFQKLSDAGEEKSETDGDGKKKKSTDTSNKGKDNDDNQQNSTGQCT